MQLSPRLYIIWIAIIFLSGCANLNPNPDPKTEILREYVDDIEVTQDKGAILGQVISNTEDQPLADTVVRLAEVFWNDDNSDGAFVLKGGASPGNITDENGVFVMEDLDPADYVIVVGEVIGIHEIVSEPDGSAKIFPVNAGEVLTIEPLRVNIP